VIAGGLAEQFVGRELRAVVAGDDEVAVCDPPAAAGYASFMRRERLLATRCTG